MKYKNVGIYATLGPKSLNKDFLNFAKGRISLLRLNMSHIKLEDLKKHINTIKKYSNIPICLDTEGAQIRTKYNGRNEFVSLNFLVSFSKLCFIVHIL